MLKVGDKEEIESRALQSEPDTLATAGDQMTTQGIGRLRRPD